MAGVEHCGDGVPSNPKVRCWSAKQWEAMGRRGALSRRRAAVATLKLVKVHMERPGVWLRYSKWSENPSRVVMTRTSTGDLEWMEEGLPEVKALRRKPRNHISLYQMVGIELAVRGPDTYGRWMPSAEDPEEVEDSGAKTVSA